MRQVLGILACFSVLILASACGPASAPRLRLSEEPVTEDGLHLVQHRGSGRMVVSPDLDRVREKLRTSPNVHVTGCGVTLKDRSKEKELAAQTRALTREFCSVMKTQLGRTQDHASAAGIDMVRPEGLTVVDSPGPGTMALQAFLLSVEVDEETGGILKGSQPTVGVLYSDSVSSEPLMRYYLRQRATGSMEDLALSAFRETYELYVRILSSEQPDVAAPPSGSR